MPIIISNSTFRNAWRDGIHIDSDADVRLENVVSEGHGRHAINITKDRRVRSADRAPQRWHETFPVKTTSALLVGVSVTAIAKFFGWT